MVDTKLSVGLIQSLIRTGFEMYCPGDVIQESVELLDQATGRETRQLTTTGLYNQTPTYHYKVAFTADSRYLILAKTLDKDAGGTLLLKADVQTGEMTVIDAIEPGRKDRSAGTMAQIIQSTNQAVVRIGKSLRLYDLDTLEHREIYRLPDGPFVTGCPIGTPDGKRVIVTRMPDLPPEVKARCNGVQDVHRAYVEIFGGMPATYIEIDVQTREAAEVFTEEIAGNNHPQPCPVDADLWLIDRDWPPFFGHGCDGGKTSRHWLFHRKTGKLTELRPRNPGRFQTHGTWNRNGDRIYYHGPAVLPLGPGPGGRTKSEYIGAIDIEGKVIWETLLPFRRYGHVSTHTQAEAIITGGIYTDDCVVAVHYTEAGACGVPHIELLARHETAWGIAPGQYPHPHCHMSGDGRWLSYNKGQRDGRSDVYVVRMK